MVTGTHASVRLQNHGYYLGSRQGGREGEWWQGIELSDDIFHTR